MTRDPHADAVAKLEADGASPAALAAFRHRLGQLEDPSAGLVPGDTLEPVEDLAALEDLPEPDDAEAREVLDRVVVLKLNGGLGTSMGLSGPKSLIEVKPGASFLDVIARQVLGLRRGLGTRLPLLLMDSYSTREGSLGALDRHEGLAVDGLPADFLQGREPKLLADTHAPVEWPANPALEWCPPGHGDVYVSLVSSGVLDTLLEAGFRWAFVSNSDNLGALVEPRVAAWMAREKVPFGMEVVRGTPADRKGGHLARRDGQLILRESAQVPDGDDSFGDVERWRFYNTNNLWVDLEALREALAPRGTAGDGTIDLPLIVNRKTVDPTDGDSPAVLQLETAMGAAVGAMEGARALLVPRTRFAPVKSTSDLLVVRSDAWTLEDDGRLVPAFEGPPPVVSLDKPYKLLDGFEARFPEGPPSLRNCSQLTVEGDVTFGAGVVVEGDVTVAGVDRVEDGAVLRG